MRRDTMKLLIFAGIIAFAVLYGMELSSKGIQEVNGPWSSPAPERELEPSSDSEWTLPPAPSRKPVQKEIKPPAVVKPSGNSSDYEWEEEEYIFPRYDRKPLVDRISGKTAEVLHDLSRNGIRTVVSIFDKITG